VESSQSGTSSGPQLQPCPRCATQIPRESVFCPRCGLQLVAQPPATFGGPPPPMPSQMSGGWRAWSGRKKALVAGGIVLALLVVIGALAGPRRPAGIAAPIPTDRPSPTAAAVHTGSTTPRATPSPAAEPTAVPAPTTIPTEPPATSTPIANTKLGSRQAAIQFFESQGFRGEMNSLSSGEERWLADNPAPHAALAEVIGPANSVDRVSVVVAITDTTSRDAGRLMGAFLLQYAPTALDWAADNTTAALLGDAPTLRVGSRVVRMHGLMANDGSLVTLTVDHD
jgi:hypothetical protein